MGKVNNDGKDIITNDIEMQAMLNLDLLGKFDVEDLAYRRLYINSEITPEIIDSIVYHILRYNRMDAGKPVEEREPIILYISSSGGDFTAGYSCISAIMQSITPVYTVNVAECCSMGLLIFIAGKKRFSLPYSLFLLHEGYFCSIDGSASKVQEWMKFETEQIDPMTREYVLERTKISPEDYDRRFREEWYFLPKEGKEIGVVDYIVGEDCTMDDIV